MIISKVILLTSFICYVLLNVSQQAIISVPLQTDLNDLSYSDCVQSQQDSRPRIGYYLNSLLNIINSGQYVYQAFSATIWLKPKFKKPSQMKNYFGIYNDITSNLGNNSNGFCLYSDEVDSFRFTADYFGISQPRQNEISPLYNSTWYKAIILYQPLNKIGYARVADYQNNVLFTQSLDFSNLQTYFIHYQPGTSNINDNAWLSFNHGVSTNFNSCSKQKYAMFHYSNDETFSLDDIQAAIFDNYLNYKGYIPIYYFPLKVNNKYSSNKVLLQRFKNIYAPNTSEAINGQTYLQDSSDIQMSANGLFYIASFTSGKYVQLKISLSPYQFMISFILYYQSITSNGIIFLTTDSNSFSIKVIQSSQPQLQIILADSSVYSFNLGQSGSRHTIAFSLIGPTLLSSVAYYVNSNLQGTIQLNSQLGAFSKVFLGSQSQIIDSFQIQDLYFIPNSDLKASFPTEPTFAPQNCNLFYSFNLNISYCLTCVLTQQYSNYYGQCTETLMSLSIEGILFYYSYSGTNFISLIDASSDLTSSPLTYNYQISNNQFDFLILGYYQITQWQSGQLFTSLAYLQVDQTVSYYILNLYLESPTKVTLKLTLDSANLICSQSIYYQSSLLNQWIFLGFGYKTSTQQAYLVYQDKYGITQSKILSCQGQIIRTDIKSFTICLGCLIPNTNKYTQFIGKAKNIKLIEGFNDYANINQYIYFDQDNMELSARNINYFQMYSLKYLFAYSLPDLVFACQTGYYFLEGICVSSCSNVVRSQTSLGTYNPLYANSTTYSCEICPQNCLICFSPLICNSCRAGFVVDQNSKLCISCSQGTFYDVVTQQCVSTCTRIADLMNQLCVTNIDSSVLNSLLFFNSQILSQNEGFQIINNSNVLQQDKYAKCQGNNPYSFFMFYGGESLLSSFAIQKTWSNLPNNYAKIITFTVVLFNFSSLDDLQVNLNGKVGSLTNGPNSWNCITCQRLNNIVSTQQCVCGINEYYKSNLCYSSPCYSCSQCSIQNCLRCQDETGKCLICNQGYSLLQGNCVQSCSQQQFYSSYTINPQFSYCYQQNSLAFDHFQPNKILNNLEFWQLSVDYVGQSGLISCLNQYFLPNLGNSNGVQDSITLQIILNQFQSKYRGILFDINLLVIDNITLNQDYILFQFAGSEVKRVTYKGKPAPTSTCINPNYQEQFQEVIIPIYKGDGQINLNIQSLFKDSKLNESFTLGEVKAYYIINEPLCTKYNFGQNYSSSVCSSCATYSSMGLNNQCFCNDGYFFFYNQNNLDGVCVQCNPLCSKCFGPSVYDCSQCQSNFFYQQATSLCVTTCETNEFIFVNTKLSQNECQKCDNSCLTCTGPNKTDCLTCSNNFYLDSSSYLCVAKCQSNQYQSKNKNTGQIWCMPCNQECLSCQGPQKTDCITCSNNYYLDNVSNLCVEYCQSNQYQKQNTDTGQIVCLNCDQACLTCQDGSQKDCITCSNMFYLDNLSNLCVQQCQPNQYQSQNPISGQIMCMSCDQTCLSCSNQGRCLTCAQGQFLYNNQCVLACPNNYQINQNTNTCDLCTNYLETNCQTCDITCRQCIYGKTDNNSCTSCYETKQLIGQQCQCNNKQDNRNNYFQCSYLNVAVLDIYLSSNQPLLTIEFGSPLQIIDQYSIPSQIFCTIIFQESTKILIGTQSTCSISGSQILVNLGNDSIIMENNEIKLNSNILRFQGYKVQINTYYKKIVQQQYPGKSQLILSYNNIQNSCNDTTINFKQFINDAQRGLLSINWSIVSFSKAPTLQNQQTINNILQKASDNIQTTLIITKQLIPVDSTLTLSVAYTFKVNQQNFQTLQIQYSDKQILVQYIQSIQPPFLRYMGISYSFTFLTQICDDNRLFMEQIPTDIKVISSNEIKYIQKDIQNYPGQNLQIDILQYTLPSNQLSFFNVSPFNQIQTNHRGSIDQLVLSHANSTRRKRRQRMSILQSKQMSNLQNSQRVETRKKRTFELQITETENPFVENQQIQQNENTDVMKIFKADSYPFKLQNQFSQESQEENNNMRLFKKVDSNIFNQNDIPMANKLKIENLDTLTDGQVLNEVATPQANQINQNKDRIQLIKNFERDPVTAKQSSNAKNQKSYFKNVSQFQNQTSNKNQIQSIKDLEENMRRQESFKEENIKSCNQKIISISLESDLIDSNSSNCLKGSQDYRSFIGYTLNSLLGVTTPGQYNYQAFSASIWFKPKYAQSDWSNNFGILSDITARLFDNRNGFTLNNVNSLKIFSLQAGYFGTSQINKETQYYQSFYNKVWIKGIILYQPLNKIGYARVLDAQNNLLFETSMDFSNLQTYFMHYIPGTQNINNNVWLTFQHGVYYNYNSCSKQKYAMFHYSNDEAFSVSQIQVQAFDNYINYNINFPVSYFPLKRQVNNLINNQIISFQRYKNIYSPNLSEAINGQNYLQDGQDINFVLNNGEYIADFNSGQYVQYPTSLSPYQFMISYIFYYNQITANGITLFTTDTNSFTIQVIQTSQLQITLSDQANLICYQSIIYENSVLNQWILVGFGYKTSTLSAYLVYQDKYGITKYQMLSCSGQSVGADTNSFQVCIGCLIANNNKYSQFIGKVKNIKLIEGFSDYPNINQYIYFDQDAMDLSANNINYLKVYSLKDLFTYSLPGMQFACTNGYYFLEGICVSSCTNVIRSQTSLGSYSPLYTNNDTLSCEICPQNCLTCSSSSICTSCKPGFVVDQNSNLCISCSQNTFYDTISHLCVQKCTNIADLMNMQCVIQSDPSILNSFLFFSSQILTYNEGFQILDSNSILQQDTFSKCQGNNPYSFFMFYGGESVSSTQTIQKVCVIHLAILVRMGLILGIALLAKKTTTQQIPLNAFVLLVNTLNQISVIPALAQIVFSAQFKIASGVRMRQEIVSFAIKGILFFKENVFQVAHNSKISLATLQIHKYLFAIYQKTQHLITFKIIKQQIIQNFVINEPLCTQYSFGQNYSSSQCSSCKTNSSMGLNNQCLCNDGYYFYYNPSNLDGECIQCNPVCSKCVGPSIYDCLVCSTNKYYSIFSKACVTQCLSNEFIFANSVLVQNECHQCDNSCLTCQGPNNTDCLTCKNSYYQDSVSKLCVAQCQSNQYQINNPSTGQIMCMPCDLTCLTCKNQGPDQCTACSQGKFLYSSYCLPACPNNYQTNQKTNTCDLCQKFIVPQCQACHITCKQCTYGKTDNNSCTSCYETKQLIDSQCKCKNTLDTRDQYFQCSYQNIAVLDIYLSSTDAILTIEFGSPLNTISNYNTPSSEFCNAIFDDKTQLLIGATSTCIISGSQILVNLGNDSTVMENNELTLRGNVLSFKDQTSLITAFYKTTVSQQYPGVSQLIFNYKNIQNSCDDITINFSQIINDAKRGLLSITWSIVSYSTPPSQETLETINQILQLANQNKYTTLKIIKYLAPVDSTLKIQVAYKFKVNQNNVQTFLVYYQMDKSIQVQQMQSIQPPFYRYMSISYTFIFSTQICNNKGPQIQSFPMNIQITPSQELQYLQNTLQSYQGQNLEIDILQYTLPSNKLSFLNNEQKEQSINQMEKIDNSPSTKQQIELKQVAAQEKNLERDNVLFTQQFSSDNDALNKKENMNLPKCIEKDLKPLPNQQQGGFSEKIKEKQILETDKLPIYSSSDQGFISQQNENPAKNQVDEENSQKIQQNNQNQIEKREDYKKFSKKNFLVRMMILHDFFSIFFVYDEKLSRPLRFQIIYLQKGILMIISTISKILILLFYYYIIISVVSGSEPSQANQFLELFLIATGINFKGKKLGLFRQECFDNTQIFVCLSKVSKAKTNQPIGNEIFNLSMEYYMTIYFFRDQQKIINSDNILHQFQKFTGQCILLSLIFDQSYQKIISIGLETDLNDPAFSDCVQGADDNRPLFRYKLNSLLGITNPGSYTYQFFSVSVWLKPKFAISQWSNLFGISNDITNVMDLSASNINYLKVYSLKDLFTYSLPGMQFVCPNGYYFFEGICVSSCNNVIRSQTALGSYSPLFTSANSLSCEICPQNCKACTSSSICTSCNTGFVVDQNSKLCISCSQSAYYDSISRQCVQSCTNIVDLMNSQCVTQTDLQILNSFLFFSSQILTYNEGFQIIDSSNVVQQDTFSKCQGNNPYSFFMFYGGQSVSFTQSIQKTCITNTSQCVCASNEYFKSNQCYSGPCYNCVQCQIQNCLRCQDETGDCLICSQGYSLLQGKCVSSCSQQQNLSSYSANPQISVCYLQNIIAFDHFQKNKIINNLEFWQLSVDYVSQSGLINCLNQKLLPNLVINEPLCTSYSFGAKYSSSQCSTCKANSSMILNNQCQCNDGYYFFYNSSILDGQCNQCNPVCSKCIGPSYYDCLVCSATYYYQVSSKMCVIQCQSNEFVFVNILIPLLIRLCACLVMQHAQPVKIQAKINLNVISQYSTPSSQFCNVIFDSSTQLLIGNQSTCTISGSQILVNLGDDSTIIENNEVILNGNILSFKDQTTKIQTFYKTTVSQQYPGVSQLIFNYKNVQNSCNDLAINFSQIINDAQRGLLSINWSIISYSSQPSDQTLESINQIVEQANQKSQTYLNITKYLVPVDSTVKLQVAYKFKVNQTNVQTFLVYYQMDKYIQVQYMQSVSPPFYRYTQNQQQINTIQELQETKNDCNEQKVKRRKRQSLFQKEKVDNTPSTNQCLEQKKTGAQTKSLGTDYQFTYKSSSDNQDLNEKQIERKIKKVKLDSYPHFNQKEGFTEKIEDLQMLEIDQAAPTYQSSEKGFVNQQNDIYIKKAQFALDYNTSTKLDCLIYLDESRITQKFDWIKEGKKYCGKQVNKFLLQLSFSNLKEGIFFLFGYFLRAPQLEGQFQFVKIALRVTSFLKIQDNK
ncbi:hypothetical protein ABPG73_006259 [Tetrahymena malaccensis]